MIKTFFNLGLLAALTACGGGGDSTVVETTTLTSTSWTNNGVIPVKYAAPAQGGTNTSPQLTVSNLPSGTATLAVIMDDESTPGCGTGANACVHWNVFNLPASKTSIAENENLTMVSGVVLGKAYNGSVGYAGPNPPSQHTYNISVFALDASAKAVPSTTQTAVSYTRSQFETLYNGKILGKVTLAGIFTPSVK